MDYIAHLRSETDKKEQPLYEHIKNVAELSKKFSECLILSDYAEIIGMLHDIGKYSNRFQQRINGNDKIKVDHSTCGAQEAFKMKLLMAAFCIAGHHGGIPNIGVRTDSENDPTLTGRLKRNTEDYSAWINEVDRSKFKPIAEPFTKNRIPYTFILRFLFSCLVDADYLDTENFMSNGAVLRDSGEDLTYLLNLLNKHIEKWQNPSGKLNILRTQMLNECIDVGKNCNEKLFTLTVPTGGGKTISSMAFALNYAVKHSKKRIIYVIPYTSIIEQNAEVFRKIFGMNNVLENHSNVDFDSLDNETKIQMMLAAENWNSPIVVTTAVQFFESMFSNKPSKCRKIHNIADSVVIFDEAQMLPLDYLLPCATAIRQLAENYNSAVVLCTATQPNFQSILNLTEKNNKLQLTEICKSAEKMADDFRRVNFKYEGKLEDDEIALELKQCKQVLCIVNKKAHAQKIYSMLGKSDENFHLSTYMYPAHRQQVLDEIRKRLDENKPCRVVSTSLVEAGVDIDFPTVYRAISGIDSILQAGGRCNRENKRNSAESVVHIFNTDEVLSYQQTNTDAAMAVIKKYGDKIYLPEAIKMYFDDLYYYRDIDKTHKVFDKKDIIHCLTNLEFETVSQRFKMIENDTKALYICTDENKEEINQLRNGNYTKELFRSLQKYVVNLYEKDFNKLNEVCAIEYVDNIFYILADNKYYSSKSGITFPDDNTVKGIFI
ncbi:CRISPR-associated helicase Cas3' [uncultured Ruminococcus sp.]|uniref:CRISPR-associated helicase Cas3' n=1 Tax=uncultured Ruminococcus sp. TaxID=165186 RepID=UPI0025CEA3C9|nr:CRISPR-associated helicase Cas3' [uncultured Ruminococcus sp.]